MSRQTVIQKSTAKKLAYLSNGTYNSGKGQAFDDYLWDTISFSNLNTGNYTVPQQFRFFRQPLQSQYGGSATGSKTLSETSMEDPGKLPAGQSFLITAISFSLVGNLQVFPDGSFGIGSINGNAVLAAVWATLVKNSVVELKFSNTEYSWRAPGSAFLPMVYEPGANDATNVPGPLSLGEHDHLNWLRINTNIPVSELVSFSVNWNIQSGDPNVQTILNDALFLLNDNEHAGMRCMLRGMLTRAI